MAGFSHAKHGRKLPKTYYWPRRVGGIVTQIEDGAVLREILQGTYFDNVDVANADAAVEALHPDVSWTHIQVWEHDGHSSHETDSLDGKDTVQAFLDERVGEMQEVGIQHKVRDVASEDGRGAFAQRSSAPRTILSSSSGGSR